METLTTQGIRIDVEPFFVAEESVPVQQQYVHAYKITIENQSDQTVQLISRHWKILESNGVRREVEGEGVVGEKPTLEPGQKFEYTSWCPMMTDIGKMNGTYQMINTRDGSSFEVSIPEFKLIPPFKMN